MPGKRVVAEFTIQADTRQLMRWAVDYLTEKMRDSAADASERVDCSVSITGPIFGPPEVSEEPQVPGG